MREESVRALKQECFDQVIRPRLEVASRGLGFGPETRSLRRARGPEPWVALGLAGGTGAGDFRLAVRMQRRLPGGTDLAEELHRRSAGECDFRYIGRVVKAGDMESPWQRERTRPLRIGLSVGHLRVTAGTLGAFVMPREGGRLHLLSNNHVLAAENRGRPGDAILQPAAYDGGRRARDVVAALARFVEVTPRQPNLVDAAIAELTDEVEALPGDLDAFGSLTGLQADPVLPGQRVGKIGRTTGSTSGVITATEVDGLVVEFEQGGLAFDRQIEIESEGEGPFSQGGDSGSLIFSDRQAGCGLLFAGSDQGGSNGLGLTYANELALVLEQLDVELAVEAPAA